MGFVSFDHGFGLYSALCYDLFNFLVDFGLYQFTIRFRIVDVRKGNVSELFIHSKFGNQVISNVISLFQVVIGSSCDFLEKV